MSVLLCEGPKPQIPWILDVEPRGTLIYGFKYNKILQRIEEKYGIMFNIISCKSKNIKMRIRKSRCTELCEVMELEIWKMWTCEKLENLNSESVTIVLGNLKVVDLKMLKLKNWKLEIGKLKMGIWKFEHWKLGILRF